MVRQLLLMCATIALLCLIAWSVAKEKNEKKKSGGLLDRLFGMREPLEWRTAAGNATKSRREPAGGARMMVLILGIIIAFLVIKMFGLEGRILQLIE